MLEFFGVFRKGYFDKIDRQCVLFMHTTVMREMICMRIMWKPENDVGKGPFPGMRPGESGALVEEALPNPRSRAAGTAYGHLF